MNRTSVVLVLLGIVLGWFARSATLDRTAYTLYRDSATSSTMRIHVATFNSTDGDAYNNENCQQAQMLFQQQPGVTVKFWCEKGTYRR